MIAIDTNVLLRHLLADDAGQYHRSKKLIESKGPALITDVVLAETVWTLMGKRFGFDKTQICGVIRALIGDGNFGFEDSQTVWSALNDYEERVLIQTQKHPEARLIGVETLEAPNRNPIEYMLDCIERDAPIEGPLSPELSRIGQQIVDTAYQSAREKRTLPLAR